MKILLIALIKIYQKTIAVFLGGRCRFIPSCSEYAKQAIEQKGVIKGTKLSLVRLSKCHPFGGYGFDPIEKGEK
ncbi:MAG: membrane protein insertion efficiency factor YidD [Oligoflexia bacterium]|nr:membrane protein insertion efficiency factor YidD [Oligoflexia bacterium]